VSLAVPWLLRTLKAKFGWDLDPAPAPAPGRPQPAAAESGNGADPS
jgi:hypothetical protein